MLRELAERRAAFASSTGLEPKSDALGNDYTTFSIGGALPLFAEVQTPVQLQKTLQYLARGEEPFKILGAGSNVLIPTAGMNCWVIKLGKGFRHCAFGNENTVKVGGSYGLTTLAREVSDIGLTGLEFAGGIPASVGGAICMNSGAHGGEMSQVVQSVAVMTTEGTIERLTAAELQFAYRTCRLPQNSVVIEATLQLQRGDREEIKARRVKHLTYRKETQPLTLPSAGSIFRNPRPDAFAGDLLEKAQCKGLVEGGASVSEMHANWIVNAERKATSDDVKTLIRRCQDAVRAQFQTELHPELRVW